MYGGCLLCPLYPLLISIGIFDFGPEKLPGLLRNGPLDAITSVIDFVDAATEEAPELPKCEHCGHAEAEQPGCILICKGCAVESNSLAVFGC